VLEIATYSITALVCLLSAFIIQRVYLKEKKKHIKKREVAGIQWFGWAILIWGIDALLKTICVGGFEVAPNAQLLIYAGVAFSLLNSLFIVFSLPSIRHQYHRGIVVQLIQKFTFKQVLFLFFGVIFMMTFIFVALSSLTKDAASNNYIWLIDIPISVVVALALLSELNKAFKERELPFMYFPSFILFLLIIIAVVHRVVAPEHLTNTFSIESWETIGVVTTISFKFLFILLFSILLYSWKFLSEKEEQDTVLDHLNQETTTLKQERDALLTQTATDQKHLETLQQQLTALQAASQIELSDRQKEVLANLGVCGAKKSYTEMAEAMHISVDGFQTHIHQIKKILNISGSDGKEQLITYATANNFLQYATISCDD
jgi:DNA-binding CsgD family transcriptional regulator